MLRSSAQQPSALPHEIEVPAFALVCRGTTGVSIGCGPLGVRTVLSGIGYPDFDRFRSVTVQQQQQSGLVYGLHVTRKVFVSSLVVGGRHKFPNTSTPQPCPRARLVRARRRRVLRCASGRFFGFLPSPALESQMPQKIWMFGGRRGEENARNDHGAHRLWKQGCHNFFTVSTLHI